MKPSQHQDAADLVAELRARVGMLGPQPEQMLRFMNGMAPLLEKSANLIEQQAKALSEAERNIEHLEWAIENRRLTDADNDEQYEAIEARLAEATRVIDAMLSHSCVADAGPDCKFDTDEAAEAAARSFLNSARAQQESSDAGQ